MRRFTPIGTLLFLALPSCMPTEMPTGTTTGTTTETPTQTSTAPSSARCRAERDRRLGALEHEEQSLRTMVDTDAAMVDAPEFQLRKTERALMKAVQEDKDAARARYRACLRAPQTPQTPQTPQSSQSSQSSQSLGPKRR